MIEIPLRNRRGETIAVALIDELDAHLAAHRWNVFHRPNATSYAMTKIRAVNGIIKSTALHREVMGAARGQIVDHVNGDGLDNRRQNLRIVTSQQNNWNRKATKKGSGFKGVSRHGPGFRAQIREDGKILALGTFPSAVAAALAYDAAARRIQGNYARLNFPEGHEREAANTHTI